MNTVTKTTRVTKLQLQNEVEQLRAALDAERIAHRATHDELEALRALRAAAIAKAKAAKAEVPRTGPDRFCVTEADGNCVSTDPRCMHNVTPCEATKTEETTVPEAEKVPTTVAEFCEWYCRVNGVKSVPKTAVATWKNAFARTCIKCNGSGRYVYADGGYGDCYACTGRGKQTHDDVTRCSNYWKLYGQP